MINKLTSMLFDDEDTHPLELDKEDHRKKEIELNQKQQELREKEDELEAKLEAAKQEYFQERDKGNEKAAERLQRDAEDIQDNLETVRTRLNAVDQMLNTVSNFQNVYELREIGEGEYWTRIREMDRSELVNLFSKEKMKAEEMMSSLSDIGTTSKETISDLNEKSSRLHSSSSLGWEEEYERDENKTTADEPEVFSTDVSKNSELDKDDLDDLNLN